jgi:hypothetical protein
MEVAIVMLAVIAYLGFRQWLQLNRRSMIELDRHENRKWQQRQRDIWGKDHNIWGQGS